MAAATASYITPALFSQATVYEFIRRGSFEPNLERICGLLRERRDAMVSALERHLPEATWTVPEGGYFVWLDLPDGIAASDLARRGRHVRPRLGLLLRAGRRSALRLAFSYESPSAIEEGVRRLASAVRAAIVLGRAA